MGRYIFCKHSNKKAPFSDFKQAKDTRSSEVVWIKRSDYNEDDGICSSILREICILRKLTHTNIIRLRDVIIENEKIAIIYEYHGIPLNHLLNKRKENLTIDQIKSYLAQLLRGLHHCHINRVIHRNLVLESLLVTRDGFLKIAGFTSSRTIAPPIDIPLTHDAFNLCYTAPEVLLGCNTYALPVDMWSVGIILAEMVTKTALFPGDSEIDMLFRIFRMLGTPNEENWPGVTSLPYWSVDFPVWPSSNMHMNPDLSRLPKLGIELLKRLLCLDPSVRITSAEALTDAQSFLSDAIVCFTDTHPLSFGLPRNNTCIEGFATPITTKTTTTTNNNNNYKAVFQTNNSCISSSSNNNNNNASNQLECSIETSGIRIMEKISESKICS